MVRNLDERESSILRALVHEYITTGKAVGSRSFVQKYSFAISPATMRNIMSDLEGMSYLMQPHTSSGRIPTDLGYRFYVNSLLESYEIDIMNDVNIAEDIINREVQLGKIFSSIAKILSTVTGYAGIMMEPNSEYTVVKKIELIHLDRNEVIVVIVTRTGMVINKKISLLNEVSQDEMYKYSRYLTSELCGYTLKDINQLICSTLRGDRLSDKGIEEALDIAELALKNDDESELHIDGIENLLKIPEMVEKERLDSLLKIIEEKNVLREILSDACDKEVVNTMIGDEIHSEDVNGCSIVTTCYKIGNSKVGVLGVIGPTRMNYEKVIPFVHYMGSVVSEFLTKMSK